MREYEFRANLPVKSGQFIKHSIRYSHGVIADIQERRLRPKDFGSARRLLSAIHFYFFQRHSRLTPELRRFAAFAIGEAYNRDFPATLCIERNRASRAPHEIRRMGTDYQRGFGRSHPANLFRIPLGSL